MGNVLSSDDTENTVLKKLYKLNNDELASIGRHISKKKFSNIEIGFINSLNNLNGTLTGKIPSHTFNLVDNFLTILSTKNQPSKQPEAKKQSSKQPAAKKQPGSNNEPQTTYSKQEVLKVFKLNNNYSEDELKISYKKLAMIHHPDRPSGNNEKFQLITKLYMALLEECKLKEEDKPFNELRNNSQDFIKKQENNNERNYKLERFEPKLFNKIFEETKINDEDNDGYKNWIENNNYDEKDIEKNETLDSNFTLNSFNTVFDKDVKVNKEIVEYKIPIAMDSSKQLSHTELGGKSGNYTTKNYSDYKEAHTTSRIIPQNVKREQYKNIGHLKSERNNIKKLSQEEIDELNKYEIYKKKQEEEKKHKQENKDKRHFDNYHNIHHKMLNNKILR